MKSSMKPTKPRPVISIRTSRPDAEADQRGDHDDSAAHGRRAPLGGVRGRALLPDQLAVAAPGEDLDRQRGTEEREDERDAGRDDDGLHCGGSFAPVSRPSATLSSPAALDAFTSTTSPR